jgi:hypothetical protein
LEDGVCQCGPLLDAFREACAERHRRKKGQKPLFSGLRLVRRLFFVFGFAIKKADGVGDALDNDLLDGDFDGFVLVGSFDFAVVGIGVKPALDENVFAFEKTVGQFGKSFSVTICYVESTRPLENRNTLGMLHFFLKLVCFLGGCRCM